MATTYEQYSSEYYFGTDSRSYRAKLFLSVTEYDTYVTIRVIGVTQMRYAYLYGVGIQVSGTGYTTQKVTGYLDSNPGSTWTNTTARTEDAYVTINKTSSVQTATYTAKAYGATADGYGSAGGSGVSVSYSVTIPKLAVTNRTLTMSVSPSGAGYTSPSVGSHTYADGTSVSISATPYSGYEFSYWSINGIVGSYNSSTSVTVTGKNWTATAAFTQKTYTVSYNANGGSGAPSSQTKYHGTTLTLSSTKPTRSSSLTGSGWSVSFNYNGGSGSTTSLMAADYYVYTFKNWNTNSSGTGTSYSAGGSYTSNASATLYAQWTSTLIDGPVTLPTPNSRTGYTFGGWYTSSALTTKAGNAGASYTPTSAGITLYAKWTGNSYTVTYNGNGATSGSMSKSSHVYGTSSALSANQFAKTGYKFAGWSTSSTATTPTYTDGQSVSTLTSTNGGNVTLYAVWEQSGNVISVYDSSGIKHTGLVTAYDANGNKHSVVISAYDSSGAKHNVT